MRTATIGRERLTGRSVLTHPVAAAAAAVVAAGYLALVDPNQSGHYPSCPILGLTGRYCPGCGGLRAVHDLLHGRISEAVSVNLVVVLMLPVVVMLWSRWVLTRSAVLSAESRWGRPIPGWVPWSLCVAIMLFWVLRNLPVTAWLAP